MHIGNNMVVIIEPKSFCFDFDLPKYVGKNLKHETEVIIKHSKSLAKHAIKNEIRQLFRKYKHECS